MLEIPINTVGELKRVLQPFVDEMPIGVREENSKVVKSLRISFQYEEIIGRFYGVVTVEEGAKEVGEV